MLDWIKQLHAMLALETRVTLVTVIRVGGSVPREVGARMLVGRQTVCGTIGGGNLEYQSILIARDRLLSDHAMECRVFALGPSLGQCCGGNVELLFEQASQSMHWVTQLAGSLSASGWLCRCCEQTGDAGYHVADEAEQTSPLLELDSRDAGAGLCMVDNRLWFCEPLYEDLPEVWLFGAGHVGNAVVAQLSLLPCRIVWVDQRAELLQVPVSGSPSVSLRECVVPAEEVSDAPAQTTYVVMTHSHAIDFEICRAVMARGDFRYLGLIGSASKRNQFIGRLRHRGLTDDVVKRMHCPLGLGTIRSRRPESIALSLAAQLAMLWEQADSVGPDQ